MSAQEQGSVAGAAPGQDVETNHEYDGIREFDNPLPRWWLMTFYATIVFSVGYWFYYHTSQTGDLPTAVYRKELDEAKKEEDKRMAALEAAGKGVTDEQLLAMSKDAGVLERGAAVFKQNCLACHGADGQGLVGPNLTDKYYLHGAKAKDTYQVISTGVLEKGMPAWKTVLGATKVQETAAYVLSLRGKNVPGKPPQGKTEAGEPAPAQ